MNSCFYECQVMHRRLWPREHGFLYRIFMFWLDLDELEQVTKKLKFFSACHPALYRFEPADHVQPAPRQGGLKEQIVLFMQEHGLQVQPASVRFLTLPRVLGYIFNPISIYYAFDEEDRPLASVVQVGNTFGEQKLYPVPWEGGRFHSRTLKEFYVSPFSPLDWSFDFRLEPPAQKLRVYVDDYEGDRKTLVTSLTGERRELSTGRLLWFTLKYPLLTLRVIFLIHFEALRLWFKRVPYFYKEANPEMQKKVHKPHRSLR